MPTVYDLAGLIEAFLNGCREVDAAALGDALEELGRQHAGALARLRRIKMVEETNWKSVVKTLDVRAKVTIDLAAVAWYAMNRLHRTKESNVARATCCKKGVIAESRFIQGGVE